MLVFYYCSIILWKEFAMCPNRVIFCDACKTGPATTFIQATFSIVGNGDYRVKCLNLALCNSCAAQADMVLESGTYLAKAMIEMVSNV